MADFSKCQFSQLHNQENDTETGYCPENRETQSPSARGGLHQFGNCHAEQNPEHRTAEGDFIGDDEMLEINEGRGNQQGSERKIGRADRKTKTQPQSQKEGGCQHLDQRVTEGNRSPASRAFRAERQPAQNGEIFIPRDGFSTGGAKRAPWFKQADTSGHPVDAGIQKRSRHRAQHGGENRKQNGHAFSRPGSTNSQIA